MVGYGQPGADLGAAVSTYTKSFDGVIYFDTFPDVTGLDPVQECNNNIAMVNASGKWPSELTSQTDLLEAIKRQDAVVSQNLIRLAILAHEGPKTRFEITIPSDLAGSFHCFRKLSKPTDISEFRNQKESKKENSHVITDRVAVISGAATEKGIGLATAQLFAEHGLPWLFWTLNGKTRRKSLLPLERCIEGTCAM